MEQGSVALVTGALGLVGAAAVRRFSDQGREVVGIDNDLRAVLFGASASNMPNRAALESGCPGYRHHALDIRDAAGIAEIFNRYGNNIDVVVHAAAQPSHDWAATNPAMDFEINAGATLTLLEACRKHAPDARFLFMSTNKVYGDLPNQLPLSRVGNRLEVAETHPYHAHGIDEALSIDRSRHSLFGVSKASADLMVQEYGSRFGLATTVFRAGCLTGEDHHGAKAHGFLAYLCKVAREGAPYEIIGHGGLQVRDNLHADELADAFAAVCAAPPRSGVYNMGGGRGSSVSVLEALQIAEEILGRKVPYTISEEARYGDHAWWISDTRAFQADYPGWRPTMDARALMERLLG